MLKEHLPVPKKTDFRMPLLGVPFALTGAVVLIGASSNHAVAQNTGTKTKFVSSPASEVVPLEYVKLLDVTKVEAPPIGENLLADGDFEAVGTDGLPIGWNWTKGRNNGSMKVDTSVSRLGRKSARFVFPERTRPNVYNSLVLAKPVKLKANTTYTLSAYLKSEGVAGNMAGGQSWQYRVPLSRTSGEWRRISRTFTATANDVNFQPRFVIDSLTYGTWVDGLKLEEGSTPTLVISQVAQIYFDPDPDKIQVQGDNAFSLPLVVNLAQKPVTPIKTTLEVSIGNGQKLQRQVTLSEAYTCLNVAGESMHLSNVPRRIEATLKLDNPLKTSSTVTFYSTTALRTRLASIQQRLPFMEQQIEAARAQGQDVSYPMVPLTTLKEFVNYVVADIAYRVDKRPTYLWRAANQLDAMEILATNLEADLRKHTETKSKFPRVPRWNGETRPRISQTSFMAPATTGTQKTAVERPIIFNGFGHFAQVVNDMEKWPDLGTNIVQIETGPMHLFPAEDRVNTNVIRDLRRTLDRAKQSKVGVCLLLSPHYFPKWMLEKYPDLDVKRYGYMHFSLYAPETQVFLKRYISTLVGPFKDHPALHSVCITNEPINVEAPSKNQEKQWHTWLEQRHETIANLNRIWGTNHGSFEVVPLPNAMSLGARSAVYYDYMRFNTDFFAKWHQGLADIMKEVAPNVPIKSKVIQNHFYSNYQNGLNPYLFSRIFNINGNDAGNYTTYQPNEFAQLWQNSIMAYDMQSSMRVAPLFNSENHLISDGDIRYVSPSHIRTSLWQGAVHGQSASVIWDWERTYDEKSVFHGLFMERPACTAEVGLTNLDLNRAAYEITALQKLRPRVSILHSFASGIWNDFDQTDALAKSYTVLSFTGNRVGFTDERQLEDGLVPTVPVLVIPNSSHLSVAALNTLKKYKGRLIFVGSETLNRDEYDRPQQSGLSGERIAFTAGETDWKQLWQAFVPKLVAAKVAPEIQLQDTNGKPVWGVEWLSANTTQGTVVNLCNYRSVPVTFRLNRGGKPISAKDVLTGTAVASTLTLKPLETRLIRVSN